MARIILVEKLPFGFKGMAIPPFRIYVLKTLHGDELNKVLLHLNIHFAQAKRMFYVGFYLRYIFQWLLIGHRAMPLEMEARLKAGQENVLLSE